MPPLRTRKPTVGPRACCARLRYLKRGKKAVELKEQRQKIVAPLSLAHRLRTFFCRSGLSLPADLEDHKLPWLRLSFPFA
jgi:hypothetical protein